MPIIQLPASATKERNILRTIDVLSAVVPDGMKKSIQFFQTSVDGLFSKRAEAIEKNARRIPDDVHLTIHAPFSPTAPQQGYNLSDPQGARLLRDTCMLAQRIGCNSVVAHFNTLYNHPESGMAPLWNREWLSSKVVYEKIVRPTFDHIISIAESTNCHIAFENMPMPIHGDVTTDLKQIFFDPCMASFEFLSLFVDEFSSEKNIGLCFDVSHYGLMSGIVNRTLNGRQAIRSNELEKSGLYQLYPEIIGQQPGIVTALSQLMRKKKIFEVQLADYGALWEPSIGGRRGCLLEEGVGILEGAGGIEILKAAVLVAEEHGKIPLAFDIDVDDPITMTRQIMGVQMFLDFLKDERAFQEELCQDKQGLLRRYEKSAKMI